MIYVVHAYEISIDDFCLMPFSYNRYVPIIPMVLVNGSEGIGTGWSSYVPNYNPLDIIRNIRHLLNDEPMEPMHPWYKGFIGSIERTATKDASCTYTVSGIIEEVDETTLRITELPIRKWTQDYKEFLESVSAENDKSKDPFIEVHYCSFELFTWELKSLMVISHILFYPGLPG